MSMEHTIHAIETSGMTARDKSGLINVVRMLAMSSADMTPEQLSEARDMAGLTAWQAHKVTGLSLDRLAELETGHGSPNAREVALLDEAYGLGDRPMPVTS